VLVTDLLPYYPVRIEFETGDLPVTWRTGDPVREIATARNAGALVGFDATALRALSGSLSLRAADGSQRPATGGLLDLRCPGGAVQVPVGSSGRFYVEQARPGAARCCGRPATKPRAARWNCPGRPIRASGGCRRCHARWFPKRRVHELDPGFLDPGPARAGAAR
jgi:hypothetical protein